mmetsp:Transcript_27968/g.48979  ORF Transcript_27968/g.48979 Transcript_27968/m.48979 type:complete len:97 (-) Transcript_27968:191-481(-)
MSGCFRTHQTLWSSGSQVLRSVTTPCLIPNRHWGGLFQHCLPPCCGCGVLFRTVIGVRRIKCTPPPVEFALTFCQRLLGLLAPCSSVSRFVGIRGR